MRLVFVSFLIAVFLPIDVTLQNFPGPPRFVPLVMAFRHKRLLLALRRVK